MKRRRILRFTALAMTVGAFASVGVPALAQRLTLRPGQYEAVSVMELPAGSPVKMPPTKDLVCFTAEDVKDLSAKIVKTGTTQDCKVIEKTATATGMKFTTECAADEKSRVRIAADVTFTSNESYREVVHLTGASSPQGPGSTFTVTAKRIGECTK